MTKITMPDGTTVETDDAMLALRILKPEPIIAIAPTKSKKTDRPIKRLRRPVGFKSAFFGGPHALVREKMLRVAVAIRDAGHEIGREDLHAAVRDDPVFRGTSVQTSYDAACRLFQAGLIMTRLQDGRRFWKTKDDQLGKSINDIAEEIRCIGDNSEILGAMRRPPSRDPESDSSPSSPYSSVEP